MSITSVPGQEPQITTGKFADFRYEIYSSNSATATLKIFIPAGQTMKAASGCMLATSSNIEISAKLNVAMNAKTRMTAKKTEGWVVLAPSCYGSIPSVQVSNTPINLGDNSFLASIGGVDSAIKTQSVDNALFSGHGLFVKQVSDSGIVFVVAVGSMMALNIPAGDECIVAMVT